MKQNIMKKWVKALRSGKYKQGKHTLKQYNSKGQAQHCCLGVLCELYNDEQKKNKKKTLSEEVLYDHKDFPYGFTKFGENKFFSSCSVLPYEVMKWAEMKTSVGILPELPDNLADQNDNGAKFKTISNIIEKFWEVL